MSANAQHPSRFLPGSGSKSANSEVNSIGSSLVSVSNGGNLKLPAPGAPAPIRISPASSPWPQRNLDLDRPYWPWTGHKKNQPLLHVTGARTVSIPTGVLACALQIVARRDHDDHVVLVGHRVPHSAGRGLRLGGGGRRLHDPRDRGRGQLQLRRDLPEDPGASPQSPTHCQEHFSASKGEAGAVASGFLATPLLAGPIASALIDRFGCRSTVILGGIVSATGFALSYFAPTIGVLFVTFGLISGIGLSMTFSGAVVSVTYYFDKRRSIATGLTGIF